LAFHIFAALAEFEREIQLVSVGRRAGQLFASIAASTARSESIAVITSLWLIGSLIPAP